MQSINHSPAKRWQILGAFGLIYFVWGSTFLAILYALETIPPLLMIGLRSFGAGIALYGLMALRKPQHPTLSQWLRASIGGICYFVICHGLLAWAETRVSSGIAAVVLALIPAWIVMFDWLRPKGQRPSWLVLAGMLLSFIGVIILVEPFNSNTPLDRLAVVGLVVSACAWGLGSIISRYAPPHPSPFMTSAMQLITGGTILLIISFFNNDVTSMLNQAWQWRPWLALLYLIVIGSMLTFSAYVWLLQHVQPAKVATYAYINPVVAVFLGWLFAHERLTLSMSLSILVILAGVVMVITFQRR